jgi:uncharacterized protein with von Willebrand factor type A (vWA) domain
MAFVQGVALVDIGNRDEVYHAARSLLLTRREHMRLFETVFNRFWRVHARGEWGMEGDWQRNNRPRHKQRPFNVMTYMAHKARPVDEEIDVDDRTGTFSRMERLQRKAFAEMSQEELETVKRLIREMRWQVSLRQTRRQVAAARGARMDLRRVLRAATKYGGVPLELAWRRRKIKQRPMVIIADISGSMEKYARIVLQFAYSVSHSLKDVECFVFGTRLTRVTPQLKLKNIDRAVGDAAREVVDWSGGTRIGESLHTFNQQWSRRVLQRGAVVLIISDGWERGDVTQLETAMRFLQHRSHRLIWLNPLSGREGYEPRVDGMAAALPYIDDFLPIHNMQSLMALSHHLASLGQRRSLRFQNATYEMDRV